MWVLSQLFFGSEIAQFKQPLSELPACGACGLLKKCNTPKMSHAGKGKKKILFVSTGPGLGDDENGAWQISKHNALLEDTCASAGVKLKRDCWLTGAMICHSSKWLPVMVDHCRPNLRKLIDELKPNVIIPMGQAAVSAVIPLGWNGGSVGQLKRWIGHRIPSQRLNAWICPVPHPSHAARDKAEVQRLQFERGVRAGVGMSGPPFPEGIVDRTKNYKLLYDDKEAAKGIKRLMGSGRPLAFDYECNMLKPDWPDAQIVSCAISDGVDTVAYMWHGKAIAATVKFLQSDVPKVGANIKFETRWSVAKLGVTPKNWVWDTMLGAHWLDNRRSNTSVKFQSFVLLGLESYNDHIHQFLKSKKGSRRNSIVEQISPSDLLHYNADDAYVEWHIAKRQREIGKWHA